MRSFPALAVAAVAALLAVGPAAGVYIERPLSLAVEPAEPEDGATLTLRIGPLDEANRTAFAGRTVEVRALDMQAEKATAWPIANVTLDGQASATLTWQLPPEADDRNLAIEVLHEGDLAAQAHVAVGDAEPMYFIAVSYTHLTLPTN